MWIKLLIFLKWILSEFWVVQLLDLFAVFKLLCLSDWIIKLVISRQVYIVHILLIHLMLEPFCSYVMRYIVFQGSDLLCRNSSIIVIPVSSSVLNGLHVILFKKYLLLKYYIPVDVIKFQVLIVLRVIDFVYVLNCCVSRILALAMSRKFALLFSLFLRRTYMNLFWKIFKH